MNIPRGLRTFTALSTATVVLVTGCASGGHPGQAASPTTTAPPGWPPTLNDFSVVWSAEPGIDLTTGPAVVVRAYTESYLLASVTGDEKFLYPGFGQSVDPNKSIDNPTGSRFRWPKTDRRPENPWVGTEQAHILSIATSGRDVTVVACEYLFGTAQPHGRGYTPNIGQPPPDSGIDPMRITMTAPAATGPQMPAQQGPAKAPSTDVFGGWRITSHQGGYFAEYGLASEWPGIAQDTDACRAKAPPHPELVRGGEYPRSDFPTLPPSPGWPATSAAS
ncbi:hypothetical protein MPRS_47500 [Mycobacterium paraseoulense]|nr:hypothetical protein MPRS_47500 [Mycobacterium paraseoulense]